MLRVTTTQVSSNILVAAAPEPEQIAGNLHWTMRRRQQFDEHRHASSCDCGMHGKAEQLLHAYRKLRPFFRLVVDRDLRAGWSGKMCRRLDIEPLAQIPWQQGVERRGEIVGADLLQ